MNKIIRRDTYLQKLFAFDETTSIKIITGIRRVGKSFLMNNLFYYELINKGISKNNIIKFSFYNDLDKIQDKYVNNGIVRLFEFKKYIEEQIKLTNKNERIYLLLDEIQQLEDFQTFLQWFIGKYEYSVYVTGSNSRFLSSDIDTNFRGRSIVIHVYPLSFSEYLSAFDNPDFNKLLNEYLICGGLPELTFIRAHENKINYLTNLIKTIYLLDLIEKNKLESINQNDTEELIKFIASTSGNDIRFKKIIDSWQSIKKIKLRYDSIHKFIKGLTNAFLIEDVTQYNLKGKKNVNSVHKFYFQDLGIKNAFLGFDKIDQGKNLENFIYNELRNSGYEVKFAKVLKREGTKDKEYEIDFLANKIDIKMYLQVSYEINNLEKLDKETKVFNFIKDTYEKILLVKNFEVNDIYQTNDKYLIWNIEKFLKEK